MNLFVTGATGFVGTHFLNQALAAGHTVTALRRPGSRPRLPLIREPAWADGTLEDDWTAALQDADALVHLAAHTANPPYDTLAACLRWNVSAPLALAEQARLAGIDRILVAGSCFEYGHVDHGLDRIPVDNPLAPNNAYATSKAAATVAFEGWAREHRIRLQVLRIFHVYGPGEPATRLWPTLQRAALAGQDFPMTGGEQVRDFVPVESVAAQFVRALSFDRVEAGRPVVRHVGSGQSQTLLEFARQWWSHWNATRSTPAGCSGVPGGRNHAVGAAVGSGSARGMK